MTNFRSANLTTSKKPTKLFVDIEHCLYGHRWSIHAYQLFWGCFIDCIWS